MRIVITGAGGFVGHHLAQAIVKKISPLSLVLVDNTFHNKVCFETTNSATDIQYIEGDIKDPERQTKIIQDGADIIYHLAALPGGAAEKDPELSKQINLDATLSLIQKAANVGNKPRVVYTSTIAVLGADLPEHVDDTSSIAPAMTYGAHKAMVELALSDMTRRGLIEGISLRLPGIVARPADPSGLKSAFMSNIFHQLREGKTFTSPVSTSATFWLMSLQTCIDNLVHAGQVNCSLMPSSRALTLPVVRCSMFELSLEIIKQLSLSDHVISYHPDSDLEKLFGAYPPITTPAAEKAGFTNDGDLSSLVSTVLKNI